MIGVFIEPKTIKVCEASFNQHTMRIGYHKVFYKRLLSVFSKHDWDFDDAVNNLSNFFSTLRNGMNSTASDGIYIVIPDFLFTTIKCVSWQTSEEFMQRLQESLPVPLDDVYYCEVMKSNPDQQVNISSIYAIEKKIIDAFYQAAGKAKIVIKSIEAASAGFFRGNGQMDVENFICEIYADRACGVYFSVVAGIFMADVSNLAYAKLYKITPTEANTEILEAFALNDKAADSLYDGFLDEQVPYTFFTDDKSVLQLEGFQQRIDTNKTFPSCVQSNIPYREQLDWLPLVGSILQDLPAQEELYKTLPSYAEYYSGNIIPDKMQQAAKIELMKRKAMRVCARVSAGIAAITLLEFCAAMYYSTTDIPAKLKQDYAVAQEESKAIDAEFSILEAEKEEHMNFTAVYMNIANALPEGVMISNLKIAVPNKKGADFATATAFSKNPVLLQSFAAELTARGDFGNVSIRKMDTNSNQIAKADIMIGRRGGTSDKTSK